MWRYRGYVRRTGSNVVEDWLGQYRADSDAKLRAKFFSIAMHLQDQPIDGWRGSYFELLRGGVGTMRFEVKNVVHRPLGFFGPQRTEFTFLMFATERGDEYLPRGCIEEAIDRMAQVRFGAAAATEWRPRC